MGVEQQLRAVFAEVLNIDPASIDKDTSPDTIPSWDSFATVSLIAAIETKFEMTFEFQDLIEATTFGAVLEVLVRRTEAAGAPVQ